MSLLLTLNIFHEFFYCFYCWFWTGNYLYGMKVRIVISLCWSVSHTAWLYCRYKPIPFIGENWKKVIGKCFPKLIIWNKILQKIIWLAEINRGSTLSVQNIKVRVKILSPHYFGRIFKKWINKFETSQISKIKKIITQVVSIKKKDQENNYTSCFNKKKKIKKIITQVVSIKKKIKKIITQVVSIKKK